MGAGTGRTVSESHENRVKLARELEDLTRYDPDPVTRDFIEIAIPGKSLEGKTIFTNDTHNIIVLSTEETLSRELKDYTQVGNVRYMGYPIFEYKNGK